MATNSVDKIKVVVEADDNASDTLKGIGKQFKGLETNLTDFNNSLRHYNMSMQDFNRTMLNVFEEMGSAVYDFTSDAISNFSDFSEQHAKTLGAMANDYDKTIESQEKFLQNSERLKQQAMDLSMFGPTGTGSLSSPVEISSLQTELKKAGVSSEDMVNTNVTKDVLTFAQANGLDTEKAVEFAVSLGSQFNVPINEWSGMLDKVSHTADLSIIDVKDIVASMKYAGGITSGIDRPIEEVLAMTSVLGNFGLRGSQAGSGIQAFMTRLLTGDTTVVTDNMKAVAPPNALEAFYEFSNYAKGGGELTYEQIKNEEFQTDGGDLLPMDQVIDRLDETMGSLNDEEQAWFAKKLFGLYQMKSAYALINGEEGALDQVMEEIANGSDGTNENKLDLLLNSQYGQLESLGILWDATKTGFGDALSPLVDNVRDQLFQFVSDKGNYRIDWQGMKKALDDSCDEIEKQYGSAIANGVRSIGTLSIDIAKILEDVAPEFGEGMLRTMTSIVNMDFVDAADNWAQMIDDMRDSASDLPAELQSLAEILINVVDLFGKLAVFNVATQGLESLSSAILIIVNMGKAVDKIVGLMAGIPNMATALTAGVPAILAILGAIALANGISYANDRTTTQSERSAIAYNVYSKYGNDGMYNEGAGSITAGMRNAINDFYSGNNITADGTVSALLESSLENYVYNKQKNGQSVSVEEMSTLMSGMYDEYKSIIDGTKGLYDTGGNKLDSRYSLGNDDFRSKLFEMDQNGRIINGNYTSVYAEIFDYMNNFKWDNSLDDNYSSGFKTSDLPKGGAELALNSDTVNINGTNVTIEGFKTEDTDKMISTYDMNTKHYGEAKDKLTDMQLFLKAFAPDAPSYGYNTGYATQGYATLDLFDMVFSGVPNALAYGRIKSQLDPTDIPESVGGNQIIKSNDTVGNQLKKESVIQNNNNITVQAPTVNVDVKVDKDGKIESKTSILNPTFDKTINSWFGKKMSQNGVTPK